MAKKAIQRFNLHDALNKRVYDHAVICSFTFDASFFEEYCLEKFRSLSGAGNITVLIDKGIYEQVILGQESARPKKANLRYLLFPVSVPGVFHPKIFLFASGNRGRLIVGSANFTRSGLTQNAEMVSTFDFEKEKNEDHLGIFQAAFQYLLDLSSGLDSRNLDSNLQTIAREADWLIPKNDERIDNPAIFLNNLTEPLWSQVVSGIEPPVDCVSILSKFFDAEPVLLDTVERDLCPNRIQIYTQNGETNLTPIWLEHRLVKNRTAEIYLCNYADDGFLQRLHAKAIAVQKDDHVSLSYGSANFTSAALSRRSSAGNMEVLIRLPKISKRKLKPSELFDPDNTAVRLTDGSILQPAVSDEEVIVAERESFEIKIYEAEMTQIDAKEVIVIRADIPLNHRFDELSCRLTFTDQTFSSNKLHLQRDDCYFSAVSESVKRKLNDESTIISIGTMIDNEWLGHSNSILVTNLRDPKTHNPVRRDRNVREAQQGTNQFFAVLRDLLDAGDQQALLTFLNFCDIPLNSFPRPRSLNSARPVWDGGEGMRKLGGQNLKIYLELHPAAIAFFDRHLVRLRKHIQNPSVNGIDNFLHIFLAMGGILRSQAERVVLGIEGKRSDLTKEEWAGCRNNIDIYFGKFRELMDCLWNDYLSPMARKNSKAAISEKFMPDLDSINQLCSDMLACRARVENVRIRDLTMIDNNGVRTPWGYFYCIFKEEKWTRYQKEIESDFQKVEATILLAA